MLSAPIPHAHAFASPIDTVLAQLDGVRGDRPNYRARCPAHGSKGGTLGVRETQDGRVLLRCYAGCSLDAVLRAAGLSARDLFADDGNARQRIREQLAERKRFTAAPEEVVNAAIDREIERLRERLRANLGYDRPLRSNDVNVIRERIAAIYKIALPPLPPFAWECSPHDDDPAWPTLYMRALEDVTRHRWLAQHRDAAPWSNDPAGPNLDDRIRAEHLARAWLRGMSA